MIALDLALPRQDLIGPCALDVREHRPDFIVGQDVFEGRHVALVARRRVAVGHQTLFGESEQDRVRIVPSVTRLVVRRCGQATARKPLSPIRLSLEVGSVTRGAMSRVDSASGAHLRRVTGIRAGHIAAPSRYRLHHCNDQDRG